MQLIVLGMHRSGTSCVARLLNMMGAYFAPEDIIMSPQEDNPKGFWERKDVMELNDEILQLAGGTWDRVSRLNFSNISAEKKQNLSHKVQQVLTGLDVHRPWFLKDPRMCLTFPFWRNLLEVPVVLIVYRDPVQVARSLERRNAIPVHVGIALWEYYMVCALNSSKNIPRIIIRYEDVLDSPYEVVGNLYEYLQSKDALGLRCPAEKEVTSFITKDLCHSKHDVKEHSVLLNQAQLSLIDFFKDNSTGTGFESAVISLSSLDILEAYVIYHHNITSVRNEFHALQSRLADACQAHGNTRAELEKQLEDSTAIKKELSEVRGGRDALETGLASVRGELSALEAERNKLQEELISTKQSYNAVMTEKVQIADQLKEVGEQAYTLLGVSELLDSQLKNLQEEFSKESEKVSQYDSWIQEMVRDTQDIFSSFRWKIGDKVASAAEVLLFRFNKKTTKDHIEQIIIEYENFIASSGQPMQVSNRSDKANENFDKWSMFCRLTFAALKNPSQTASMLGVQRLKNLYITMFKQSPHVRENIFDYYLKLYGENNPEPFRVSVSRTDSILDRPTPSLPKAENPLVSIIIPVFNQWEYTEKCIRSIFPAGEGLSYEVILADDCSTDDTINAEKIFPGIKIVKTPGNRGFLLNCNNAAKKARGSYLVFLNNDTVVHENWLQAMLEIMDDKSEVGMTGSKFIYPDGKLQEAGGIIWNDASGWNYGRLDDPVKPEYNYVKEVDYISGASIMIRHSLWKDIGGFDERYVPAYYEDSDLAFAVREKGFKVVFTPFSVVTHFEGQSHGTNESSGIKKNQAINKEKFREKWQTILDQEHLPNAENVFDARQKSKNRITMLVVDHYVPFYDQDAGSKSTFQYLQWFVESGLNIIFIGDNFYQHEPYTSDLQKLGIEVLVGPWYAKNWKKWVKENGKFIDYAYLHRPHIAPKYIETIRKYTGAKIIYFGHDLHYLRLTRQYEIEKDKKLLEMAGDWRRKEFAIFEQVDVVYYPSFVETEEITKHFPGKCIKAIPLNIYENISVQEPDWINREGLMFVGGFGHPPNLDAVLWFVNDIFPFILEKNSSVKLTVVGTNVPEDVRQLVSENIVIADRVSGEELKQIYNSSLVSVVPLRYGAGIKGKVLEALYSQVPVVTTEIGAEGLPGTRQYLRLANEPESFAVQVMQLLADKDAWVEQVKQGVDCLNTYFSSTAAREVWDEDVSFSN